MTIRSLFRRAVASPLETRRVVEPLRGRLAIFSLHAGLVVFASAQFCRWLSPAAVSTVLLAEQLGVWLVALPTLRDAVFPSAAAEEEVHSNRLVALATLASLWSGETLAAFLAPLIMQLGHWLESRSIVGIDTVRASLLRLSQGPAFVIDATTGAACWTNSISPGQLLRVRPGETLVADGVVEAGQSTMEEASFTGESYPRRVEPGARVLAGATNGCGLLHVRAIAVGETTEAGRMASEFDAVTACKPRMTRTIERYAQWYVPCVLLVAIIVSLVTGSGARGVSVLLIFCPCALALAGPVAMIALVTLANRAGIVVNPHGNWEALADVDAVVFDKTGTLTRGDLRVVKRVELVGDAPARLEWALGLAECSTHPASRAVAQCLRDSAVSSAALDDVREFAGQGLVGRAGSTEVLLGSGDWLLSRGVKAPRPIEHHGPIVLFAADRCCLACFLLEDSVRDNAEMSLSELRSLGVRRAILLTGDHAESARHSTAALSLDETVARCTPQEKRDRVLLERARGHRLAMVGDGVNDTLALAAADVGVVVSRPGDQAARGAADVILSAGDLSALPIAIRLARGLRRLVFVNLLIAACCALLLAGAASGGLISPLAAAGLHNIGAMLVLLHSGAFVSWNSRKTTFRETSGRSLGSIWYSLRRLKES